MTGAKGTRGFTLLELSIVLFIIALVTGMAVTSGISVVATARLTATQKKMKAIDEALMQFRVANDRLPCPGDLTLAPGSADYGIEAGADATSAIGIGTGVCTGAGMLPQANHTAAGATNTGATGAEGALPAVTLGLPPDFMLDGWGNKIRYAVDISYTANGVFASTPVGCTNGAITVNDGNGVARSTSSVYALISHGANGHGAYTKSGAIVDAGSSSADELTNCHCTSAGAYNSAYAPTYVQKDPTYDSGHTAASAYYFDDLVSFRERWQMRTDWDKSGKCMIVYVADTFNGRVQWFNGNSYAYMGQVNVSTGGPWGVGADASGNIWAGGGDSIVGLTPGGTLLNTINNAESSDAKIDAAGNVWGAGGGNCLTEYSSTATGQDEQYGPYMQRIGPPGGLYFYCQTGSGVGQFSTNGPTNIAFDASGDIWATDTGNYRVEKFSSNGTYLMTIGGGASCTSCASTTSCSCSSGTSNGMFLRPYGVAVDASGNIWVSDAIATTARVQEFDKNGNYLSQFGSPGGGNGQFGWAGPMGLAIDPSGNIWVADFGDDRVEEFSPSGQYINSIGTGYNGVGGSIGNNGNGNGQMYFPASVFVSGR